MRYKVGLPTLVICTALRAAMICQACDLDKKNTENKVLGIFWCGRREFGTWLAVNSIVAEMYPAQACNSSGIGVQSFNFHSNKKVRYDVPHFFVGAVSDDKSEPKASSISAKVIVFVPSL